MDVSIIPDAYSNMILTVSSQTLRIYFWVQQDNWSLPKNQNKDLSCSIPGLEKQSKTRGASQMETLSGSHGRKQKHTSSVRSVRIGVPFISKILSPGWIAFWTSGLICIRLTLNREDSVCNRCWSEKKNGSGFFSKQQTRQGKKKTTKKQKKEASFAGYNQYGFLQRCIQEDTC